MAVSSGSLEEEEVFVVSATSVVGLVTWLEIAGKDLWNVECVEIEDMQRRTVHLERSRGLRCVPCVEMKVIKLKDVL